MVSNTVMPNLRLADMQWSLRSFPDELALARFKKTWRKENEGVEWSEGHEQDWCVQSKKQ
jgi:hypothetical protein